jgi:uncharacterized protein (DUF1499 family)
MKQECTCTIRGSDSLYSSSDTVGGLLSNFMLKVEDSFVIPLDTGEVYGLRTHGVAAAAAKQPDLLVCTRMMNPIRWAIILAFVLKSKAFQSPLQEQRWSRVESSVKVHRDRQEDACAKQHDHHQAKRTSQSVRREVLKSLPLLVSASLGIRSNRASADDTTDSVVGPGGQAVPTISPCQRSTDPSVPTTNCVSTASVRQLDMYMPPWTFNGMTKQEVVARLRGAIASDSSMMLLVDHPNYLKAHASRNFYTDELEFVVNETDEVVTFRSSQVSGPMVSDFNANRKRLDEIRVKARLGIMGQEYELADPSSEGPLGQLKAFYGLQSGEGFEDINLDR